MRNYLLMNSVCGEKTKRSVILETKSHCSNEQLEITTQAEMTPTDASSFFFFPKRQW